MSSIVNTDGIVFLINDIKNAFNAGDISQGDCKLHKLHNLSGLRIKPVHFIKVGLDTLESSHLQEVKFIELIAITKALGNVMLQKP